MIDHDKICTAVKLLLEGIGEDPTREGLRDTPARVARMCEEIYGGYTQTVDQHLAAQFSTPHNGLVMEKNISFYSICEHHLLPFFGQIHLAYIPNGRVLGLSKLARIVEVFAASGHIQVVDIGEDSLIIESALTEHHNNEFCKLLRKTFRHIDLVRGGSVAIEAISIGRR